jgi:hypothetical protein
MLSEKKINKISSTLKKVKFRLWSKIVTYTREKKVYPLLYRSYWNSLLGKKTGNNPINYFSAVPHPGAGIGHQMANWISGYWWAKQFRIKFAHTPFSSEKWESFLGFGEEEERVATLIKKGYKSRVLPLFNEEKAEDIGRIKKIVNSYAGQKVVFICEQNQFYENQYGVMNELQQKFYSAPSRLKNKLCYNEGIFNIAIHVRRGDILKNPNNPNLQMRFIANDYFANVLKQVLEKLITTKSVNIYFFSQGKRENFPEFEAFKNLYWCLDMGAQDSFLHMVYADLLITSKSSFSYKPALLNQNIKVCPQNFWHGYPNSEDWIMVDEFGNVKINEIKIDL